MRSLEERLLSRRRIVPDLGCWEWKGALDPQGYGRIKVNGSAAYVHRVSWEHYSGCAIADGLEVDHLCENRRCFNPMHLEVVTPAVNTNRRRNAQATRTHCPANHRYSGDNLRTYVDRQGYEHRVCATCAKARARAQRAARGSD